MPRITPSDADAAAAPRHTSAGISAASVTPLKKRKRRKPDASSPRAQTSMAALGAPPHTPRVLRPQANDPPRQEKNPGTHVWVTDHLGNRSSFSARAFVAAMKAGTVHFDRESVGFFENGEPISFEDAETSAWSAGADLRDPCFFTVERQPKPVVTVDGLRYIAGGFQLIGHLPSGEPFESEEIVQGVEKSHVRLGDFHNSIRKYFFSSSRGPLRKLEVFDLLVKFF